MRFSYDLAAILCKIAADNGKSARDKWKELQRTFRWDIREIAVSRHGIASVHYAINARAEAWFPIQHFAENGKVGYVRAGMDCDCTQYRYEGVMDVPAGAYVHVLQMEEHERWLDGPESIWYRSPTAEVKEYHSRDLALEAYEDGHPSVVRPGQLEEV